MKYNKLVRDKIPEIIKNKDKKPFTHIANKKEYWIKLLDKLKEEIKEFYKQNSEEEFVDILEVLDAIGNYMEYNKDEIKEIKRKKQIERGGFRERIILERVEET